MANWLLDRQARLLDYLTSGVAIFGEADRASRDPALLGIDPALLHLEARFSYEKRMEKISAAFPKTLQLLGMKRAAVIRAFVDACPPSDIGRLANARQFHGFLHARWQHDIPDPAHLPDVAACELACATVRAGADEASQEAREKPAPAGAVRRHPGIVLVRCRHDVRPIFEQDAQAAAAERDTPLVVAMWPGAAGIAVMELAPVLFELIAALDDWTDPATFGPAPELSELLCDLVDHGLVEVSR
jgi:hypothetical protein